MVLNMDREKKRRNRKFKRERESVRDFFSAIDNMFLIYICILYIYYIYIYITADIFDIYIHIYIYIYIYIIKMH